MPETDPLPAPPVDAPVEHHLPELFADLDTAYLRKTRNDLNHVIPGDATWASSVSRTLQHLLNAALQHPARLARDKAAAEKKAADLKAEQEKRASEGVKLSDQPSAGPQARTEPPPNIFASAPGAPIPQL